MRRGTTMAIACMLLLTACNRGEEQTGPPADWSKVGETDGYVYYADRGSIKRADETVTMAELFDYKTARTEGGGTTLSKKTDRTYDCQNQKSQAIKTTWYAGRMGGGGVVRSNTTPDQLTAITPGSATATLVKIACGAA